MSACVCVCVCVCLCVCVCCWICGTHSRTWIVPFTCSSSYSFDTFFLILSPTVVLFRQSKPGKTLHVYIYVMILGEENSMEKSAGWQKVLLLEHPSSPPRPGSNISPGCTLVSIGCNPGHRGALYWPWNRSGCTPAIQKCRIWSGLKSQL